MSRQPRPADDLAAAAAVHAARQEIVQALGPLAASPLDEQATIRMRRALERAESPAVRRALRRVSRPGESRPPLQAVPKMVDGPMARCGQVLASAPRLVADLGAVCVPSGAA